MAQDAGTATFPDPLQLWPGLHAATTGPGLPYEPD